MTYSQKSSSSESLSEKGSSEVKKSFDAVVFDVLKVTPEEYAVSRCFFFFILFVCGESLAGTNEATLTLEFELEKTRS